LKSSVSGSHEHTLNCDRGDSMYTQNLIDHFQNPRNVGCLEDADGVGTVGDPECGDFIRIYIRVKNNRLKEVLFEACGCPASIATTSVLTELALDKSLDQAFIISEMDVVRALGGLPDPKIHCSNLGAAALRQAILYYKKSLETKQEA